MSLSLEEINTQVTALGKLVIDWARPDGWVESPLADWPLANFNDAFFVAVGYLAFVLFGSLIMQFLPAIPGLYPLKFLYNIVQVMLCSYMCIEAGIQAWKNNYTVLPCNEFNQRDPAMGLVLYIFYISKVLDFADTFFIILEKKWNQLSFLHVYHHTSIFLFYWLNINVGYDGDVYLTIVLNGLIHAIMYTYYFVSLHTKEIWWKSALTLSQMIQFVLMNAQALYLIFTDCKRYPQNIIIAYLFYILTLLVLFANFFIMSYIVKKPKGSKKSKTEKSA